eukprot:1190551-Alexandrium_andersonii.AAC.1
MDDPVDVGEGRAFDCVDPRTLIFTQLAPSSATKAAPATEPKFSGVDAEWVELSAQVGGASLELVRRYRTRVEELRA